MFGFFQKTQDPVCKMGVDKNKAQSLEYQGVKYYFCSENCKNQFNTNPKDYVKENVGGDCCQSPMNAMANKS